MRRFRVSSAILAAAIILTPGVAHAAAPPPIFGSDWDDPVTAAPPVERPHGRSCTTRIVDAEFRDFTPFTGTFTPPAACRGPWQKVVLTLHGAIAGRQYDRLGYLRVGGITIFKHSTPQPSPDGIEWTVDKDVTGYAPLLSRSRPVEMLIGNVVDDTYTGILDVTVDLTFYPGRAPEGGADQIIGLADQHNEGTSLVGALTVPRNAERLVAEVYATSSGGGCEEYWYLSTPPAAGYSCAADAGPYREVQIRIDGTLAGVAAPYPHVYTGGWSNPFLWYTIPAPRAFDIQPIRYDLTPFTGTLTDGRPHRVEVSVLGVPPGQSGWDVPTSVLAWRDPHRRQVTGALVTSAAGTLTNTSVTDGRTVTTTGRHSLTTSGYVDTSHGRVTTTVTRAVTDDATHTWAEGETTDALEAVWTDTDSVTTRTGHGKPTTIKSTRRYVMDGATATATDGRRTTSITLTDAAVITGAPGGPVRLTDTYTGEASFLTTVPRPERQARGVSREHYLLVTPHGRYDRTVATEQGYRAGS
ncbi:peptide-N4-asparagine amidase [Catenuloplanes japonicus]|uniref:peptide-N4-asparagine amidase n=1 Tax=Catenuloplanes japonicus TaxID=33876 RepID=UPI000526CB49|nr:peptide-N4-asparagine amidase [Catenuloplanes japonicus]